MHRYITKRRKDGEREIEREREKHMFVKKTRKAEGRIMLRKREKERQRVM